jgi:hypothetical protein
MRGLTVDTQVVVGVVVVLVLAVIAVLVIRGRRRDAALYAGSGGADAVPQGPTCLLCRRALSPYDEVAGFNERAARELIGRLPTAHPETDPAGNPRWLAHGACARHAGVDLSAAAPAGSATSGEVSCPACGNPFKPASLRFVTKEDVDRYGPDPVQCPQCGHMWNAGRNITTLPDF